MKEIINGLTKTIGKLRKEIRELTRFRELFTNLSIRHKELGKQLAIKGKVARVEQKKNGVNYVLQIIEAHDTPEGMFIKVK